MNDGFRIASRGVAMAEVFKCRAKVTVIIDLSVEDDPHGPILIRHWLMPAAQIHDTEPTESKRDRRVQIVTGVIRPAVEDCLGHSFYALARRCIPARKL